ncbi:hypothetical protein [Undibacterium sp.]|jgi:hypothetical protein|uniref:hypothetical protein n=1 Tax=Undibacterium sp. TaxID=1914977 RepID=UPI002CF0F93E|nr:hypothetical protein [Undibacterium sp.]HTD06245.1 hypothetical protein [Undibacterium sp.]
MNIFDHPEMRGVPTPALTAVLDGIGNLIIKGAPGCSVRGPAGVGKTWAFHYALKHTLELRLQKRVFCIHVSVPNHGSWNEFGLLSKMASEVDGMPLLCSPQMRSPTMGELLDNVRSAINSSKSNLMILVIDEVWSYVEDWELDVVLEVMQELNLTGIRTFIIFSETTDWLTPVQNRIKGRFGHLVDFPGICTLLELRAVLEEYDKILRLPVGHSLASVVQQMWDAFTNSGEPKCTEQQEIPIFIVDQLISSALCEIGNTPWNVLVSRESWLSKIRQLRYLG